MLEPPTLSIITRRTDSLLLTEKRAMKRFSLSIQLRTSQPFSNTAILVMMK